MEEALDHGLSGAVAYSGGELTGFSMKIGVSDYLLTIRALFPAGHMIGWVGGESMVEVLLKAVRMANVGEVRWHLDQYRNE